MLIQPLNTLTDFANTDPDDDIQLMQAMSDFLFLSDLLTDLSYRHSHAP